MARKTTRKPASRKRPSRPTRRPARRNPAPKAPSAAGGGEELLDMSQAIDLLKTTRPTFYRWLRTGKIKGMKVGRQWRFRREDIDRFLKGQEPRVELPINIGPLNQTLAAALKQVTGAAVPVDAFSSPVSATASLAITLAARMRASDIHIEPYEKNASIRLRIDGVLHKVAEFDVRLLGAVAEQFKRMANVDVLEKRLPQDGRIVVKLSPDEGEQELDLRVNFLPALTGEAVTVRVLRRDEVQLSLERIDYSPADRDRLIRAIEQPWGLVVISGPTGCGKTTVLYSCLTRLARPAVKCMSAEDPVEYMIPGVVQVGINERIGFGFDRAVRAFLRSDPDIMLIGEIRNLEILMSCLQAALTGHLVMTTLHSDSAAGTLKRMVDIGAPPFVIADATRLVSSQRLVRCLCRKCSVPDRPSEEQLERAEQLALAGGLQWETLGEDFRKPVGCPDCGQTGYRGRTLIAEMLEVTPEIGRAVRDGASVDEMRRVAVEQGMTTMAADGIRRAAAGQTTLAEVFRVLSLT